jgi:putative solute:sodium symporter small subunit
LSLAVVLALLVLVFFLPFSRRGTGHRYPLGLVVAASGLPLAGVLLIFWFASRQGRIDQQHGVYED